jgi:primosomal replication protein N
LRADPAPSMNRLVLQARLAERGVMRYTPAGLPALDVHLQHESELVHEGHVRRVSLSIKALAIGSFAASVSSMDLGETAVFEGFLAPARNGKGLLFHISGVSI